MTTQNSSHRFASITPTQFTQALAFAANGVNLVTTDGEGGRAGLTVSSMCSVCAEPPVVLACVEAENEFCKAVNINAHFAINLLNTSQIEIAKVFAGLGENPELNRFEFGKWGQLKTGAPILEGALVSLDCTLSKAYRHGTHMIYIGRVVASSQNSSDALVYCMREFRDTAALNQ